MMKRKVKVPIRGLNKYAVPFIAWGLMVFLVFALPPLMDLSSPMTIGVMVWMLLVSNVTSWFVSAFQRWMDEVNDG